MRFDSLGAFMMMDGHGLYVWAAYGVALVVVALNLLWPKLRRLAFIREEKRLAARRGAERR